LHSRGYQGSRPERHPACLAPHPRVEPDCGWRISRRLGHASPTITLGAYGHLYSNTDDRAAQVMEAMFSKLGTD
jgi:hypothetical protein